MEVQLLKPRKIDVNGESIQFRPGDWVDVGKQLALRWLQDGTATLPNMVALYDIHDIGLVSLQASPLPEISVTVADRELVYNKNIFWQDIPLQNKYVAAGATLLNTWQLVIPMIKGFPLASQFGTAEEQAETKAVVHDLRIPVYDHRLVFAQRCPTVRRFIEVWKTEEGTPELALLRAIHKVKPLVLPVPYTWTGEKDDYR